MSFSFLTLFRFCHQQSSVSRGGAEPTTYTLKGQECTKHGLVAGLWKAQQQHQRSALCHTQQVVKRGKGGKTEKDSSSFIRMICLWTPGLPSPTTYIGMLSKDHLKFVYRANVDTAEMKRAKLRGSLTTGRHSPLESTPTKPTRATKSTRSVSAKTEAMTMAYDSERQEEVWRRRARRCE